MRRPLFAVLGVIVAILVLNGVGILGVSLWYTHPDEMEALNASSDFIEAVEQGQMAQAWDMLAPDAQAQLNQASFLKAQDFPAVIQEFRNAGITLGPGPTNGRDYRGIGIQMNNPPPAAIRVVVTYSGDQVVISNIWENSGP